MFRLTKDMENNITIQQWTRRERQTNHTMTYNLPKKTGEYQSHKVFLAYDWLKE